MIQRKKLFATFVRFGMVGVLATALHYGLYYLLHFIFRRIHTYYSAAALVDIAYNIAQHFIGHGNLKRANRL